MYLLNVGCLTTLTPPTSFSFSIMFYFILNLRLYTHPAEIWLNDNELTGSLPEELFGHRTLGE